MKLDSALPPARTAGRARVRNGYEQYGVQHLAGLLLIRRLVELGVPLPQVERLAERLAYHPAQRDVFARVGLLAQQQLRSSQRLSA